LVIVHGLPFFVMAFVFTGNLVLPEIKESVYHGGESGNGRTASLQVHAQQSVHWTAGSLRHFQAFF